MVAVLSAIKKTQGIRSEVLAHQTVLVVDRDFQARKNWTASLEKAGFGLILAAGDLETAQNYVHQNVCDVVFIDPHTGACLDDGFELIKGIRALVPGGIVALLTGNPSFKLCFRAARAGVNDFFVKGPNLSIANEAIRMVKTQCEKKNRPWNAEGAFATGLFSSVGVTRGEMAVLEEFARGYPKQQDIARRLDKDEVYIRKVFSRVYKKMENHFPVNNQAQLSHIMTICSLFN